MSDSKFTKKFYVAMPVEINGPVVCHMAAWLVRLGCYFGDRVGIDFGYGNDVAHVRNMLIHRFLKDKSYDVIWFVDSDMDPRLGGDRDNGGITYFREAMERDDVDVLSGVSFRWGGKDGPIPCVVHRDGLNAVRDRIFGLEPGLHQVKDIVTGGACIAVKRHVLVDFLKHRKLWFRFNLEDEDPRRWGLLRSSEDVHFIRTAEELGHRVWIDTRVQWGHIKPLDMRDELERSRRLLEDAKALKANKPRKPLVEVAKR